MEMDFCSLEIDHIHIDERTGEHLAGTAFFSSFLRILNLFSLKNGLRVEVTLTITGHYQVLSPLEEMVRK